jgi:hypothetical protein
LGGLVATGLTAFSVGTLKVFFPIPRISVLRPLGGFIDGILGTLLCSFAIFANALQRELVMLVRIVGVVNG